MGETAAASNQGLQLQVSVSFGRFENDCVSWEKWSTFSPNKYLEEVEKCATPGSVAQKAAYFEAHYKNIAARKAELLSQEKDRKKDPLKSEDEYGEDESGIFSGDELCASENQNFTEGINQETLSFCSLEGDFVVSGDYQISCVVGEHKELKCRSDSSQEVKPEVQEEEERPWIEAEDLKESYIELDKEMVKASEVEAEHVKMEQSKDSKVAAGNSKINTAKAKKKPVLPSTKAAQVSTSRTLKGNSPSLSGRGTICTGENKRIANKSLHMSLSLGPSKPDPAPHNTMRKSSILEKMGDKEIVKQTFKTFQSINLPKSSGEERSSVKKQIPSKVTEPRVQSYIPLRKGNGRSTKVDVINKISGNSVRASRGLRSDMGAEKGKEFPKRIEEKMNAKEVERVRLQSKLKEPRETENKKVKHNFKATPLPAFYRNQKVLRNRSEKGDINSETP